MERPSLTFFLGSPRRLLLLVLPAAFLLAFVWFAAFRAQRTLGDARTAASHDGQLSYSLTAVDPAAKGRGPDFVSVGSVARYTIGAYFAGKLYLAGPSGLSIFGADAILERTLRPGIELPAASITAMAGGRLRGMSEPKLLLATGGAGLLILQPNGDAAPTLSQFRPSGPEAGDLTALLPLSTGELLLGTRQRGVLLWNGQTLTPVSFSLPEVNPATLQVTSLAGVDASSYLIGTRNSGLIYLRAGTAEHAGVAEGLPDSDIEALAVYQEHAYAGTPLGTAEFNLGAQSFRPARVLGKNLFSHALDISAAKMTVGTLDRGVHQIPLSDGPHFTPAAIAAPQEDRSETQRVNAFILSPDALYALMDGELMRRESNGWVAALPTTANAQRLADDNISALAFAPDGSLYVGFFDHGLDILPPTDGSPVRHLEDDHLFCINRLVLDPDRHTMAAATANGLVLFDQQGKPRQTLTHRDGLISDHVTDIAFTLTGTALATPAGITFLSPHGMESLYGFQGLVNNHVYALAAKQDQLLAGTLGGISILGAEAVTRNLTVANSGLKHNWITALVPTSSGYLVGTYGAGLFTMDAHANFVAAELPAGTPHDLVINPNAVLATPTHIYAGTLGHGLLVYTAATGRWSAVTSGLPSLNVTAFAARDGKLYVGTEDGLVRIAEADLP